MSLSGPLVVRVKRAADEEPLDVIRLCPPRSKIARGVHGSFSLQSLEFKRAGTIHDKNELPARTAELIDNVPLPVASNNAAPLADAPSASGVANEVSTDPPLGKLRRNHRMYMIAKSFRPVSTMDLDDILDPWTRFYADGRETNGDIKRKLEEDAGSVETCSKKSFVLCDLETYNEPQQDGKNKRTGRNQATSQHGSGITCNNEEMMSEILVQPQFVYDVYTFNPVEDPRSNDLYADVQSSMTDLDFILGTNADNEFFNEIEIDSDPRIGNDSEDEDSNAEDNWRNDYPDEDEEENDSDASDGSGSGSSDEDNFDAYGYGEDHSYARRAYRSKKTSDSDDSSNSGEKDEE